MRRILPINASPIKKYRIANGMTVIQLAKRIKKSRQTVYNYEAGIQMPPPKLLVKIATILDVEPKDLIS